jgi:AbrB family looped-hinge helix DNA binding protein
MTIQSQHIIERGTQDMELLKLRRAAQLTLPLHLRKAFGLKDGDYLEVEVVEEGILLKPVTVVERKKAWENAFQAIEEVEDRQPTPHQTIQNQEEEIADMVKDFRQHHE